MKKMKHLLLFTLTFFITNTVYSQKNVFRIEKDTLEVYPDKVLVGYREYTDSTLTGQGRAFIYPATKKFRTSRWLPRFIKTTCMVDSVVLHGETKDWLDGNYRIGKYDNGRRIKMTYYNEKGEQISQGEFYNGWRMMGDPEKGTGRFWVNVKKKK